MIFLEITEESLLDELFPSEDELMKEAWPLSAEETVKEFEAYLMEIGVRI